MVNIRKFLPLILLGVLLLLVFNMCGSYNTVVGGSLGNVDMLVFDGVDNNGYFILDNLTLTTIPLPTAGAMGFAGIGLVAMRRRVR